MVFDSRPPSFAVISGISGRQYPISVEQAVSRERAALGLQGVRADVLRRACNSQQSCPEQSQRLHWGNSAYCGFCGRRAARLALLSSLSVVCRLPFTISYGLSLFLTLYATLWAKSYVLTLIFSLVQLLALSSFLVSYIPGGKHMLKFIGGAVWQMVKRACNCKDARDMQLPL